VFIESLNKYSLNLERGFCFNWALGLLLETPTSRGELTWLLGRVMSLSTLTRLCDMASFLLSAGLSERLEGFDRLLVDVTSIILLLESSELVLMSPFTGICGLG
jgi:hypothetical protein